MLLLFRNEYLQSVRGVSLPGNITQQYPALNGIHSAHEFFHFGTRNHTVQRTKNVHRTDGLLGPVFGNDPQQDLLRIFDSETPNDTESQPSADSGSATGSTVRNRQAAHSGATYGAPRTVRNTKADGNRRRFSRKAPTYRPSSARSTHRSGHNGSCYAYNVPLPELFFHRRAFGKADAGNKPAVTSVAANTTQQETSSL